MSWCLSCCGVTAAIYFFFADVVVVLVVAVFISVFAAERMHRQVKF